MKKLTLLFAKYIAFVYSIVPFSVRRLIIRILFLLESRISTPDKSLTKLFIITDDLTLFVNENAMRLGNGIHPKHRLMKYHDFFVSSIGENSTVLDIGCGYGSVAKTIATQCTDVKVIGVDFDQEKIDSALKYNSACNIEYICADATKENIDNKINIIVLSNVLEHIEDRVNFLKRVAEVYMPEKVLIRVPSFERQWEVPMRKELGCNYFSDSTHYIEHTEKEFRDELAQAKYKIKSLELRWGEIWAISIPESKI